MNGPHDLGGQMGFGAVAPEAEDVRFHEEWEKRALALTMAVGGMGLWNIDASRYAKETMPPAQYLGSSYYQRWILALEKMLLAHRMVTAAELSAGRAIDPPNPAGRRLDAQQVLAAYERGGDYVRQCTVPARFAVGDAVLTRNDHPITHTRLPRYARGRRGRVDYVHGVHILPDTMAHGLGENPEWLYSVSFAAGELWGAQGDPTVRTSVECWESYIEPA
jgi:nitrile hydratase